MQYSMTEEFASAMVTVIPIILLVASVEFNNITKSGNADMREHLESQRARLQALREGRPAGAEFTMSAVTLRHRTITIWFWAVLVMSHIWAEVTLIGWLAGTERGAEPVRAALIAWIATFGFVAVLIGWVLTTSQFLLGYRREHNQIQQEIDTLENQGTPDQ